MEVTLAQIERAEQRLPGYIKEVAQGNRYFYGLSFYISHGRW